MIPWELRETGYGEQADTSRRAYRSLLASGAITRIEKEVADYVLSKQNRTEDRCVTRLDVELHFHDKTQSYVPAMARLRHLKILKVVSESVSSKRTGRLIQGWRTVFPIPTLGEINYRRELLREMMSYKETLDQLIDEARGIRNKLPEGRLRRKLTAAIHRAKNRERRKEVHVESNGVG